MRRELGIGDAVEFRCVPYDEMPAVFASASAWCWRAWRQRSGGYVLGDIPRFFWEEQFGLVLAEAMAAGLPIVASQSGAIPEVCGEAASYFLPGRLARGWHGSLAEGPLSRPPGERADIPSELVQRYSTQAAAERLAAVYDRLLSG